MSMENMEMLKNKIKPRIIEEENNHFPQSVLIDNISYCNLRCSMCPHSEMKRPKGKMDWELYRKIIDEIANTQPSTRVWITFFGEGLMLEDLPDRIRYAKEKGLTDIVLNTNGTLLNHENSVKLIQAGLDGLYVGVDAFKEETYQKIRIGGNLNKTVQGVLAYKAALEVYGNNKQAIFVQFVEMDSNVEEVEEFVEFWNSTGITVKIRPMVSWAGKVKANNLIECEERLPCNWAMNSFSIADDGRVCLCAVDLNCEEPCGDIKQNTIKELWDTTFAQIRGNHLNGRFDLLPNMCQNCSDWQSSYANYVDNLSYKKENL